MAEAESSAGLQTAVVTVGGAAAIRMEMASVRRRMGELRIEQADLEAVLATLEKQWFAHETVTQSGPFAGATVTNKPPSSAEVALFRSLFTGQVASSRTRRRSCASARTHRRACEDDRAVPELLREKNEGWRASEQ
nr:hypothetical protein [Sphingomonas sp. CDS-1]